MKLSRDGAVLSVMVLMCIVDGEVAPAEVMRIRWIYKQITTSVMSAEDVQVVIAQAANDDTELDPLLAQLATGLQLKDRHMVLKAAFAIASADGKVLDEEDALMIRIAKALKIAPEDYSNVIRHLMVASEFG